MKKENPVLNKHRFRRGIYKTTDEDGTMGKFILRMVPSRPPMVILSTGTQQTNINGKLWEHVSVSMTNRTPTWEEMCFVKNLFWEDEETVVQFHPKKSEYRNLHPYCLHLWKRVGEEFELPPAIAVAPEGT